MSRDNRSIAEMPFRVVIATLVAVVSLSLLSGLIDAVEEPNSEEVTVTFDDDTVSLSGGDGSIGGQTTLSVRDGDGRPLEDSTVVVTSGSAPLEGGPLVLETGEDSNELVLRVVHADEPRGNSDGVDTGSGGLDSTAETVISVVFRQEQRRGTLDFQIRTVDGVSDPEGTAELVLTR